MIGWHEVREYLAAHPELRKYPHYSFAGAHPLTGHCYVACEVLYHLGAKADGWIPTTVRHEGTTHWFLHRGEEVADPTAEQYETPVPYAEGRGRGFLPGAHGEPSKRAQRVLAALEICAPA